MIYLMKQRKLELYDLENDLSERNDLSGSQPRKVAELARLWTDELKRRGAQMPVWKATGKAVAWPDELIR